MRYSIILFLFFCMSIGWSQNTIWINCLSGEQVHDIAETDVSLWIATHGGLVERNKLTGANRYYNCANSELQTNRLEQVIVDSNQAVWIDNNGLTSIINEVWTKYPEVSGRMTLDEAGNILVANTGGLHKWNGSTFDLIPLQDDQSFYIISDVIVNKTSGDIWVSSYTFGLFRVSVYRNGQWETFDDSNSDLPFDSSVGNQFSFDADNTLWIATYSGLYSYDGNWTNRNSDFGLEQEVIKDLVHDIKGNAYALLAYSQNGIIKRDENSVVATIKFPDSFEGSVYPNFISVSDSGGIRLGNSKYGLWEYGENTWGKIKTTATLLANNSLEVYKDPSDDIYLSSGQTYSFSQLFSYREQEWKDMQNISPFTLLPENSGGYNFNFYGDKDSEYYMHFYSSLYANNGEDEWMAVEFPDLEENVEENNTGIFVDVFFNTWLLIKSKAYLFLEENDVWQTFLPSEHGATSGAYNAVFNHPITNDLWLSSNVGLSVYDYTLDSWQRFSFRDYGLSSRDAILNLDSNGTIWGYNSTQFFRMTDLTDIEILLDLNDSEIYNRFSTILIEESKIWLGINHGIMLYEDGQFTMFDNTNSGMSTGMVNGIVRDDNENLWISAFGGLTIYNPEGISEDLLTKSGLSKVEEIYNPGINIYPNPNTDSFTIIANTDKPLEVSIYTMLGEELFSKVEIRTPYLLEHDLRSGIYVVILRNSLGEKVHAEKVVVSR